MSRKSENSAGDGDPVLSSFDDSPRKPEFGIAGPYGDHTLDPSFFIFKADNPNFTSDDDEFENCELKSEYLQRLNMIREKLATIDIANQNYYNECFAYPPSQCKIVEISNSDEEQSLKQSLKRTETPKPAENNEVIHFDTTGLKPSSKEEILDLNYNPPKKKPCFRESTPKFTVSEGAMFLSPELKKCSPHFSNKTEKDSNPKSPDHLFPEIKIEGKQSHSPSLSKVIHCHKCRQSISPDQNSRKSSAQEELYLVFLDTIEQQQTPKSNHSIMAKSTTSTLPSTPRVPKKRRLFLRSARNKVKPFDQMTLWEDLRTRDAMKKIENSASSRETFFEHILLSQSQVEEKEPVNVAAVGSLDVPRKEMKSRKLSSRFPSITKLTKLFWFGRKPKNVEEPDQPSKTNDQSKEDQTSNTANLLLKLKQRQDLSLEEEGYNSSSGAESDFNYTEGDDDELEEYYQQFCLFCYCF